MATLQGLLHQRAQLEESAAAIRAAIHDIQVAGKRGQMDAGYAGAWAAIMMTTDILKSGLSAGSGAAAAMLASIDAGIVKANKFLAMLGRKKIITKSDLMKSVDPNFRGAASFLQDIKTARSFLAENKVAAPKKLGMLLDLSIAMADDTILLMQAGQVQQNIASQTKSANLNAARQLHRVLEKLRRIDEEIINAFGRHESRGRIA